MAEPRVSVLVPAYRCAGMIGRAIDSILAQTRPPEEIIVIDDGSPDDIAGALAPYGQRVHLLRKDNGGASSARNAGIRACTGELVALLDADDFWHPDKLATQLALFRKHPELGLVASRYIILSPDGTTEHYPYLDAAPWDRVLRPTGPTVFDLSMLIWTSSVVIRREVLGEERFDEQMRIAEDRDLWVRLVRCSPIYLQSEPMATLVERQGSLSRSDIDLDCQCMLQLIQRYGDLLRPAGVRRWRARVHRRWAADYLGLGRPRRAIRPATCRLINQPLSAEGWWILGKSMVLALNPRPRPRPPRGWAGVAGAERAAV